MKQQMKYELNPGVFQIYHAASLALLGRREGLIARFCALPRLVGGMGSRRYGGHLPFVIRNGGRKQTVTQIERTTADR